MRGEYSRQEPRAPRALRGGGDSWHGRSKRDAIPRCAASTTSSPTASSTRRSTQLQTNPRRVAAVAMERGFGRDWQAEIFLARDPRQAPPRPGRHGRPRGRGRGGHVPRGLRVHRRRRRLSTTTLAPTAPPSSGIRIVPSRPEGRLPLATRASSCSGGDSISPLLLWPDRRARNGSPRGRPCRRARSRSPSGVPMIFSTQASRPDGRSCRAGRWAMRRGGSSSTGTPPTRWTASFVSPRGEVRLRGNRADRPHDPARVAHPRSRLGWLPFARGRGIAQYTSDPVFTEEMTADGPGALPGRPNVPGAARLLAALAGPSGTDATQPALAAAACGGATVVGHALAALAELGRPRPAA